MDTNFSPGDEVLHKSNSVIKWVVDSVEGNNVICSRLVGDPNGSKIEKQTFLATHIKKVAVFSGVTVNKSRNNNRSLNKNPHSILSGGFYLNFAERLYFT